MNALAVTRHLLALKILILSVALSRKSEWLFYEKIVNIMDIIEWMHMWVDWIIHFIVNSETDVNRSHLARLKLEYIS